ncbi:expressed unknown protein [Ectocarpus siliculosus]|uniref:Uncharacterized protein n=1 Tax=Ectocarpus siliculosus TaxID=2880 RepID=D8LE43_ECTSI|nr:expressed unknown protein [Ectocarpus siliculosus]|eukprot:CBN78560.1 expressed unknown protein [Ectocarpus siliculosus]
MHAIHKQAHNKWNPKALARSPQQDERENNQSKKTRNIFIARSQTNTHKHPLSGGGSAA